MQRRVMHPARRGRRARCPPPRKTGSEGVSDARVARGGRGPPGRVGRACTSGLRVQAESARVGQSATPRAREHTQTRPLLELDIDLDLGLALGYPWTTSQRARGVSRPHPSPTS
eukprot:scaffold11437_cov75-Phaeocystis_antarctica.AAC.3